MLAIAMDQNVKLAGAELHLVGDHRIDLQASRGGFDPVPIAAGQVELAHIGNAVRLRLQHRAKQEVGRWRGA